MSDEPLDPTKWPKWKYHLTLPPTMVATPDAEAALQDGYRDRPFSEDEVVAFMRAERDAEDRAKDASLKRMERELTTPVAPPQAKQVKAPAKQAKRSHQRKRA